MCNNNQERLKENDDAIFTSAGVKPGVTFKVVRYCCRSEQTNKGRQQSLERGNISNHGHGVD